MENGIGEEWEMVDRDSCFELEDEQQRSSGKSRLGWVIDRGLSLGKKLVITGIVVSSAPIVLPPLVVISALGFAFSVPYGVVLGSYACSQKVMSKLLPLPGQLEFYQTVGGHDEEERSGELKDIGIEMRGIELVDSTEYGDGDGPMVEQEGLARDGLRLNDGGGGEHLSEQGMDEKESANVGEPDDCAKAASESINAGDESEEKGSINEKDASSATDQKINGGRQEQDASGGVDNVGVQTDGEMSEGVDNKEREPPLLREENEPPVQKLMTEPKKAQADSKGRRGKKKPHGRRKDNKPESPENINVEGEHLKERGTDELGGVSDVMGESEHSEVDANLSVKDDAEEKIPDADSGDVRVYYSESRIVGDDGSETAAAVTPTDEQLIEEKGGSHPVEGFVGEERIWEKLDAIRGIVGFKAPKRSSYYEELKVLYLFTGIEPPSTASDEFANNMSFLMSVIGLK